MPELLPHRPPMILLDELLEYGPERARCRVRLRPDAPFVEAGRARAVLAVELMAQAVGAYAGMRARERGLPPALGFLLGTRELRLHVPHLSAGDELTVDVEHVFGDDRLGSFRCSVQRGEETVAEAVLNVFQAPPGSEPGTGERP